MVRDEKSRRIELNMFWTIAIWNLSLREFNDDSRPFSQICTTSPSIEKAGNKRAAHGGFWRMHDLSTGEITG
jgi:hypothetical protein